MTTINTRITRYSVIWVTLPPPVGGKGHEQSGYRPAIAVQEEISALSTMVVVPLTSQLEAVRFPFTCQINPSVVNGLSLTSIALVFQIQVIDKKRIERRAGELEQMYIIALTETIKRMLGFV